jgi:mono/diheme cytochrome c family protein
MQWIRFLLLLIGVAVLGTALFIYSGVYGIGADTPHTRPVFRLLETLRERALARRAAGILVPPPGGPDQLRAGGEDYAEMCAGCHLRPGLDRSEISVGLYPPPPNLSKRSDLSPAEMFWVIKHGLKMTAMPAWGKTHDDARIWAMVVFLQRLPQLTPEQYQTLTAGADHHHGDAHEEHEHEGHDEQEEHGEHHHAH